MTQTCIRCNKTKDISAYKQGMRTCRYCKWLEKKIIPDVDGWSNSEIRLLLELIYDQQIDYLNELEQYVSHTIDEIVVLLRDVLQLTNIHNHKL